MMYNTNVLNGIKKKILVVEDNEAIAESLQYLLQAYGYDVRIAENADFLNDDTYKDNLGLILLDYWLPKKNGGEITRFLKSNDQTKHIPVVIISASYNIRELVIKAGADDFIPKPYDMNFLLSKIAHYLGA